MVSHSITVKPDMLAPYSTFKKGTLYIAPKKIHRKNGRARQFLRNLLGGSGVIHKNLRGLARRFRSLRNLRARMSRVARLASTHQAILRISLIIRSLLIQLTGLNAFSMLDKGKESLENLPPK